MGQMTVADFCAKLGCSVGELVARGGSAKPPDAPVLERTKEKLSKPTRTDPFAGILDLTMKEARAEFEQRYLQCVLEACSGNRMRASRQAGISRSALYSILSRTS